MEKIATAIQTECCGDHTFWTLESLEEGVIGLCDVCDKPLYYVRANVIYSIGPPIAETPRRVINGKS